MALARARCFASTSAAAPPSAPPPAIAAGETGVRGCALAILEQHKTLLRSLDDATYTFPSALLQASVGQHTRHSLDHLRKPIEALLASTASANDAVDAGADAELVIRYDLRQRNTVIEHDRNAAIDQIERLQGDIRAVDDSALRRPLRAAFMLSGDGHEFAFESTLSRELAFGVHHCIHHNALSKVLLRHHFPELPLPPDFGMAPSTTNFINTGAK
ncbi:hypothetical protein Gpo141_00000815 [Globisporangium polare]